MESLSAQLTVIILTFNEEDNIERTLNMLLWVPEIVVVDSGSTDSTIEKLSRVRNLRLLQRRFDTFAKQCNYALSAVKTPWVLSLDADYVLSQEMASHIRNMTVDSSYSGYTADFVYCIGGKRLRGSLYPPRKVLYRRNVAEYVDEGHGHRVLVTGEIGQLPGVIYHDDRKPFSRWITSQASYAKSEASYLLLKPGRELPITDKVRRSAWLAPLLVLPYVLIAKRCVLDGWPGWHYALQRLLAEVLIALELINRRLQDVELRESK